MDFGEKGSTKNIVDEHLLLTPYSVLTTKNDDVDRKRRISELSFSIQGRIIDWVKALFLSYFGKFGIT